MLSSPASKRLLALFERDLRNSSTEKPSAAAALRRPKALSVELDHQVVEFAAQVRTSGCTPEQMLIDLKTLLSGAAPEVPSSERSAFVSFVTGRAIASFFGAQLRRPGERSGEPVKKEGERQGT
jgi:hypothetical protein